VLGNKIKEIYYKNKNALNIIGIIIFIFVIFYAFYSTNNHKIIKIEDQLKVEYYNLPHVSDSKLIELTTGHKSGNAYITGYYSSTQSYDNILNFYNDSLTEQGWKVVSDKDLSEWGQNKGDKEFIYKNGKYSIYLQINRTNSNYSITYEWDEHNDQLNYNLRDDIIKTIDDKCVNNNTCQIRMKDITNFKWDKVVIFQVGSSSEEVSKALGFEYNKSTDLISGIIFA